MLKGERVTLRAIERSDLPQLWAFNNDLEVEVAGGGDPPRPQSLARVEADFDRGASQGGRDEGSFVIEVEGQVIGQCALFNFDYTARTCELGIAIGDKAFWGRGFGREAVGLLTEYTFRQRNMRKLWLRVLGKNQRAILAYRACGFEEEGRQRAQVWSDGDYDDLVYMACWPKQS
jgi:RimJ/RimL family protein N-acetyltransferase